MEDLMCRARESSVMHSAISIESEMQLQGSGRAAMNRSCCSMHRHAGVIRCIDSRSSMNRGKLSQMSHFLGFLAVSGSLDSSGQEPSNAAAFGEKCSGFVPCTVVQ